MMGDKNMTLSNDVRTKLIEKALEMRNYSYVPYSHFRVGAGLLCSDGDIVGGCNIENAAYGPTNCAERTAFFKAVSEGKMEFDAIAIAGGPEESGIVDYCSPCGVCRQVMMEFCSPKSFIIVLAKSVDDYKEFTLEQLMPESFSAKDLKA